MWVSLLVGENFFILLDVSTAVEDRSLDLRHVLAEPLVLVTDLEGQLAGVAHNQDRSFSSNRLDLLKRAKNEDGRLSETRLCLAENIGSEDCLRNADLLDCWFG